MQQAHGAVERDFGCDFFNLFFKWLRMKRVFKRISEGLGETPRGTSRTGRDGRDGSGGIAPDSLTRQLPTTPKGDKLENGD